MSSRPRTPAGSSVSSPTLDVSPAGQVLSYHEHNESARTPELVERLLAGERVVVVTDAGMPSVSDPGLPARRRCGGGRTCASRACPGRARSSWRSPCRGFRSTASASRASCPARPASGPARPRRRSRTNAAPSSSSRHRTDLPRRSRRWREAFGPTRRAAVCRELTKTYEEVRRGTLAGTRRVGAGRGQGRDHRRGERCRAEGHDHRGASSAAYGSGLLRASASRTSVPTSLPGRDCRRRRSTTPPWQRERVKGP